jgi:hypothetical protein
MSISNFTHANTSIPLDIGCDDLNCKNLAVSNMMNVNDINVLGNVTGIALNNLDDVSYIAGPNNNEVLTYDSLFGEWQNKPIPSGVTTYLGLSDTPANYSGDGLRAPRVNLAENAMEFSNLVIGNSTSTSDIVLGGGATSTGTFTSLNVLGTTTSSNNSINIKGTVNNSGGSICIGNGSTTTNAASGLAIGANASCDGFLAIALGSATVNAASNNAIAIGNTADATGINAICIGASTVNGTGTIAIGNGLSSGANEEKFGTGYAYNNSSTNYTLAGLAGTGTQTVQANASGVLARGPILTQGSFLPTASNVTNISITAINGYYWQQIGDTVTCHFTVLINTPTIPGVSRFDLNLPVARSTSGNFANTALVRGGLSVQAIDNAANRANQGNGDNFGSEGIISVSGTETVRIAIGFTSIVNTLWMVSGTFAYRI